VTAGAAGVGLCSIEPFGQANCVAHTLGVPRIIPPDEIELLNAEVAPPAGRWAYSTSLVEEPE